jgi:hypothetical protein
MRHTGKLFHRKLESNGVYSQCKPDEEMKVSQSLRHTHIHTEAKLSQGDNESITVAWHEKLIK